MTIVDFQNVHRAYTQDDDVLAGVTFSIDPGRWSACWERTVPARQPCCGLPWA